MCCRWTGDEGQGPKAAAPEEKFSQQKSLSESQNQSKSYSCEGKTFPKKALWGKVSWLLGAKDDNKVTLHNTPHKRDNIRGDTQEWPEAAGN